MTRLTKPLKYHGGKHYLAAKIVKLMPAHTRYLEAFVGGASVLLAKPLGASEYINDTNGELTNFWRVLARPTAFNQFKRMVDATPLSQWHFENAEYEACSLYQKEYGPDATSAYKYFVRMRMSRQGLAKDYCTPTSRPRREMNEQSSAWLSAVDGLPEVHGRLRQVEVWNRPATEAIRKLDCSGLLVYADPPYLHETRTTRGEYGAHEMTTEQHVELLECLSVISGKFMLSGYFNPIYDRFANDHKWNRVDFDLPNNASSKKSKQRKIECLWMNF